MKNILITILIIMFLAMILGILTENQIFFKISFSSALLVIMCILIKVVKIELN